MRRSAWVSVLAAGYFSWLSRRGRADVGPTALRHDQRAEHGPQGQHGSDRQGLSAIHTFPQPSPPPLGPPPPGPPGPSRSWPRHERIAAPPAGGRIRKRTVLTISAVPYWAGTPYT